MRFIFIALYKLFVNWPTGIIKHPGKQVEGIAKYLLYLFIKVPRADDGPVGHGEAVAGALGHLHPPGGHPQSSKLLCNPV